MKLNATQRIQEAQYDIPYHYIPTVEDGDFKLHYYWAWGLNYLSGNEYLTDILKTFEFDSLVDVGCGDGRFLKDVYAHFPNKRLLGVDYSKQAIGLAQAMNPRVEYQQLDIFSEHQLGTFDVVSCVEVLEHIPLDMAHAFVAAMAKLQKVGNVLLLTVPHKNQGLQKKHFQHFDRTSLEDHIKEQYEVERFFFFDKKSKKLSYLRRLLKNKLFILNHQPSLNRIYRYYKRHFLHCEEQECARIGVIARKK